MMSESGGKTSRPWAPQRSQQQAHSPASKLPEGDRVFFLLDRVPQLDLRRFYAPDEQETRGAPPCDPAMMVCLLLDASCVGVFSSRTIALACERHWAFMAIVGEERPDFRTISDCRTWHWEACTAVCVQVVRVAGEAGWVTWGNVATDGTTIQGNASRHQAMSDGYRQKEVDRLREAIDALVTQASQQDEADDVALGSRRGDERPEELARRESRLAKIEAAMQRLEAQAKADAQAERQCRAAADAERRRTGQKRRGQVPQPVVDTPDDKAQSHFTDPERPIMRTNNKGGDDCGNAQASVDGACQIIWACDGTDATNDKEQAEPLAQVTLAPLAQAGIAYPKNQSGAAQAIPATLDNGYESEAAVQALETWGFDPYLSTGRQPHHTPEAEGSDPPATAKERMAAKVRTPEGRAWYARRKVIVEPVCGQIKEARGFRRFLRRGLQKIRGAWCLVCLTHHVRKLWRYGCAPRTVSPGERAPSWDWDGPFEGLRPCDGQLSVFPRTLCTAIEMTSGMLHQVSKGRVL